MASSYELNFSKSIFLQTDIMGNVILIIAGENEDTAGEKKLKKYF